jgi:hypothetical protein
MTTKRFQTKIPPRCFQGGEKEVERKGQEDNNDYTSVQGSKQPLQHYNTDGAHQRYLLESTSKVEYKEL